MQTSFSPAQLADPTTAASEAVIRKCVHCGFCTATCPTYVLLGDELDSPRGRIYLIKEMIETAAQPTAEVVKHIDRCLSCLSCMTTCPSGVNYMHLVDHARAYIEERYRRPVIDRVIRSLLANVLPYPRRFRLALRLARLARPFRPLLDRIGAPRPLAAMLELATAVAKAPSIAASRPATKNRRVVLMRGCVEPVLRPEFQAAATRLLNRLGYEVIEAEGEACCGALVRHMGRDEASLVAARRNVLAWDTQIAKGLDAIILTTSGCGPTVKDYGYMLRTDPDYAEKAARVSALVQDISEFLAIAGMPAGKVGGIAVAYHAACSMQHGQKITAAPVNLLKHAGFVVLQPAESHLCCGSAGTYNILQPAIAGQLGDRKAANLELLDARIIVTGNIGCATQIGLRTAKPVVHIVELLDWATGGPQPQSVRHLRLAEADD